MQLFNYFRSSASYRVRIALGLKNLGYDYRPVHLLKNEQHGEPFASQPVSHLVPLLQDGAALLSQSMAIIEYLDETHPEPPLLPQGAAARAQVRALAQDMACEIHPLANLRVLRFLTGEMGVDEAGKLRWIRHWVETGLPVVEARLRAHAGRFCFGDTPGLADCVLAPLVFTAQRFECPLDAVPELMRVHGNCMALPAFAKAHPSQCPDAE
jgi:maleylacetoacetate isomerase/maleylpyruvate isomerase